VLVGNYSLLFWPAGRERAMGVFSVESRAVPVSQNQIQLKRDHLVAPKSDLFFAKKVYILYHNCMKFKFDENKSISNKEKHGLDFEEAMLLWDDRDLFEIPAKTVKDENRYLVIGKIGKKHWSAVITYRGDSFGIISVRRSREEEIQYYES
jgi:uncharacterized protein